MFPLGGVFLFPRTVLPLHIFEPRYRQMVEDSLDAHGRIVIGTVADAALGEQAKDAGAKDAGAKDGPISPISPDGPSPDGISPDGISPDSDQRPPQILPVAGIGEIVKHEKLDDGRFLIWLVGLSRVEHQEVDSDRLYRKVVCRNLAEVPPTENEVEDLRPQLEEAVRARAPQEVGLPEDADVGFLADILLQLLQLPKEEVAGLFTEPDVVVRAERALEVHRQKQLEEWQQGDGLDGDGAGEGPQPD